MLSKCRNGVHKKHKIRYEEYASCGPPKLSAAASHVANEEYLAAFDGPDSSLERSSREKSLSINMPIKGKSSIERTCINNFNRDWVRIPDFSKSKTLDVSDRPLLCMNVNSSHVVVGSSDHALYEYSLDTGKKIRKLYTKNHGHTEWVTCVKYLLDGRVVSGGMDSKIFLWGTRSFACKTLEGHYGSISALEPSIDCCLLLSSSYDKTMRLWNISNKPTSLMSFEGHKSPVMDFSWNKLLQSEFASGSRDGNILVWDLTKEMPKRRTKAHKGHVTRVVSSSDSPNLFYSGGQDGYFHVWDTRQIDPVASQPLHASSKGSGAIGDIHNTVYGNNNTRIITTGADKCICVLDPRASFRPCIKWQDHSDYIYSLRVRGSICYSGCGSGKLYAHDINSGKLMHELQVFEAAIRCIDTTERQLILSGDNGNITMYEI